MALFVNREQQRTQLQEKLAADLKNKLNHANVRAEDTPSTMLENNHQTRPAGMLIALLLVVLVIAVVAFVIFVM